MPSNTIYANYVREFHDKFYLDVQQQQTRFEQHVNNRGKIVGTDFTINKFGTLEMTDKTARLKETELSLANTSARVVPMRDKILATALDCTDETKMIADLRGPIRQTFMAAVNRQKDSIIYNALLGTIAEKTVYEDSGLKNVALPDSQKITVTGPLTKGNLIAIRAMFQRNGVGVEQGEELNITYNADMLETVLNDTTLTSADFLAVQMLQSGKIDESKWLGFNWIPYESMNSGTAEGSKIGVAWAKSAIDYGWNNPQEFRIDSRPDLQYATQFGGVYSFGAGRTDEKKVVVFEFGGTATP